MTPTRRSLLAAAAGALLLPAVRTAQGQEPRYPTGPVKIILSNAVGGALDTLARAVAEQLSATLGQPTLVEARPGANGLIGTQAVVKAPPDGQTLLYTTSSLILNSHFRADQIKPEDLAPIALVAMTPNVFAINASIPANTLQEFIALVKANPRKYSFGSLGVGSSGHMLGEMLNKLTGMDMVHTAYKGESPIIIDLLSGQISGGFGSAGNFGRQAATGKVRLLAFGNTRRLKAYPNVPTFGESGLPEMNLASGWMGMFAPASTPRAIVARLGDEVARIASSPEFSAKVVDFGFEPVTMKGTEYAAFLRNEYEKWGNVIKTTGIKLE